MPPKESTATSVVPPPTSTTIEPVGSVTGRPAPIAAAIGSSIRKTRLAPALSADSWIARRSTAVEPDGTQTMICGVAKLRRLCTLRMKCLFDRARTGKSRRLQVAMQDSVMHYSRGMFITQARTGKAAPRRPPANNPPGGIYPCKPGGPNDYVYLLTSRANPEHWPRLLTLIGREDLIGDARYDTPDARLQREAEVDEIITAWTRQRTKHEAMAQLSAVGVPAGAVFDSMELTNEPSFR